MALGDGGGCHIEGPTTLEEGMIAILGHCLGVINRAIQQKPCDGEPCMRATNNDDIPRFLTFYFLKELNEALLLENRLTQDKPTLGYPELEV